MSSKQKIAIGLFGFGCVGQGFYKIFSENKHEQAYIKKIVVKTPHKLRPVSAQLLSFNANDILQDSDISIVVEAIDDAAAAYQIARQALLAGKHVVTANKKMLALHGSELRQLAQAQNRALLYEAAVAGSIPVMALLREYYALDNVLALRGIINGSTNYILTQIAQGLSYAEALEQAQKKGFAESDPSLDVEGYDAAFKLSILIYHAFGLSVLPQELLRAGINRLDSFSQHYARRMQYRIRLIAKAELAPGGQLLAFVMPTFVTLEDSLYHVEKEDNALQLQLQYGHPQLLQGKGAGSTPTGLAIMADVGRLLYGQYDICIPTHQTALRLQSDALLRLWVSGSEMQYLSAFPFEQIEWRLSDGHRWQAVIGSAHYQQVKAFLEGNPHAPLFIACHTPEPLGLPDGEWHQQQGQYLEEVQSRIKV